MAHVILTVSRFDEARTLYCELLPFLGMHKVYDGNNFVYHVGGAHCWNRDTWDDPKKGNHRT